MSKSGPKRGVAKIVVGLITLACLSGIGLSFAWKSEGQPSSGLAACQIGSIQDRAIAESSGIIASRKHPGVFWTHNDQGNDPILFAINRDGQLISQFRIDAKNDDWEDIAIDDAGNLYIGNIGNNGGKRDAIEVLRIGEPDPYNPASSTQPLKVAQAWHLAFPDEPFNCESLFIHQGKGYLISKATRRQAAGLYSFPLDTQPETIVLQEVATLPIHSPVTAADISADGQFLAVVNFQSLDVFRIDNQPARAAQTPIMRLPFDRQHNIEACCFVPGGILATVETREIYFFSDSLLAAQEAPPADSSASDRPRKAREVSSRRKKRD
ncbi:MAG: hypothetical protein ACM359_07915 [Bacillota bacterium]